MSSSSIVAATSSPRNRSVVRVGVRVRPLTSKEITVDGNKPALSCHGHRELRLGAERRFTYDAVFDESAPQEELYRSVAPPLLDSFLEGYNATVRTEIPWTFLESTMSTKI